MLNTNFITLYVTEFSIEFYAYELFSVITYVHFMFRHRATWFLTNQSARFAILAAPLVKKLDKSFIVVWKSWYENETFLTSAPPTWVLFSSQANKFTCRSPPFRYYRCCFDYINHSQKIIMKVERAKIKSHVFIVVVCSEIACLFFKVFCFTSRTHSTSNCYNIMRLPFL